MPIGKPTIHAPAMEKRHRNSGPWAPEAM
jgi:hypothetical protein